MIGLKGNFSFISRLDLNIVETSADVQLSKIFGFLKLCDKLKD